MSDGIIGATMTAHTLLPGARTILRISVGLSNTAKQRSLWITWYFAHGENKRLTARHFGIAPNTFYKWFKRHNRKNLSSLENHSTKPRRVRRSSLPRDTINLIKQLRTENMALSKYKLATILFRDHQLTISPSTVGRVLFNTGLIAKASNIKSIKRRRRISYSIPRIRASKQMRYQCPGHLIQVDTKHLLILGQKFYQFNAIDCFTKLAYSKTYRYITSTNGEDFIKGLVNFFPFPVTSIQTDNGSEYLLYFHQELLRRKITHYFSHPQTPKDNPMIERFIQTTESELWLFDDQIIPELEYLNQKLTWWLGRYNTYRPHQSLNYQTPMAYYQSLHVKLTEEGVFRM